MDEYKNMNFGQALGLLGIGKKVARAQWGGRGFITLQTPDENSKMTEPYIYFQTIPSNPDEAIRRYPYTTGADSLLSKDWEVVD